MGNIKTHPNLPGPLAEGNSLADKFTKLIALFQVSLFDNHMLYIIKILKFKETIRINTRNYSLDF